MALHGHTAAQRKKIKAAKFVSLDSGRARRGKSAAAKAKAPGRIKRPVRSGTPTIDPRISTFAGSGGRTNKPRRGSATGTASTARRVVQSPGKSGGKRKASATGVRKSQKGAARSTAARRGRKS